MEWEEGLVIMECSKRVKGLLFLTSFLEEMVKECGVKEEDIITGVGEEKDNNNNLKRWKVIHQNKENLEIKEVKVVLVRVNLKSKIILCHKIKYSGLNKR